ncbi:hypothetical protein G3I19_20970 [Streptomyces sp. SID10853]|uniref:hypothetical protein n=1 Tax=Streptomyces sp. SID10853 TaxID=2706028 RepID=UPI0013BFE954|nr:hypothetical protein [Streptomyces sp. SID10853]NDZ80960.1 hypothetical protein [Streptomyces sp. SID10853]
MTEHGFDLAPRAASDIIAQRNSVAGEACRAIAQAGIPVYRAGEGEESEGGAGATVYVDPLVVGGVLVEWHTEAELKDAVVDLLVAGVDPSDPPYLVRHHETIHACMQNALLGILASAGFHTEKTDGHIYGRGVFIKDS